MTYLVSHVHKPEDCSEFRRYTADWFKKGFPTQVKQAYLQPGEHTYYFEVECGNLSEVYDLFRPLERISCQRISPVFTKSDLLTMASKKSGTPYWEEEWLEQEIFAE